MMRTSAVRKIEIVTEGTGKSKKPLAATAKTTFPKPTVMPAPHDLPPRVPVDHGYLPFLIKRDGTWLYKGTPINRKPMVCLFSTVLKREEDGSFFLETPVERGLIDVEDAPFIAVELDWTGHGSQQCLSFRTNTDQCVTAGRDHPIRVAHDLLTCEPTPYLHVRDGKGSFPIEARINRATYYELVALAEPGLHHGRKVLGVWSDGVFFSLGDLPPGYEDKP
jgi:hypothetical protein